jgi:hypothetical protein
MFSTEQSKVREQNNTSSVSNSNLKYGEPNINRLENIKSLKFTSFKNSSINQKKELVKQIIPYRMPNSDRLTSDFGKKNLVGNIRSTIRNNMIKLKLHDI